MNDNFFSQEDPVESFEDMRASSMQATRGRPGGKAVAPVRTGPTDPFYHPLADQIYGDDDAAAAARVAPDGWQDSKETRDRELKENPRDDFARFAPTEDDVDDYVRSTSELLRARVMTRGSNNPYGNTRTVGTRNMLWAPPRAHILEDQAETASSAAANDLYGETYGTLPPQLSRKEMGTMRVDDIPINSQPLSAADETRAREAALLRQNNTGARVTA